MTTETTPNGTAPATDDTTTGDETLALSWMIQERWLLDDGTEVTRILGDVPHEIRLGDLMQYAGRSEAELLELRKTGRCLRIIADQSRIFVCLPERIVGVYVELLTPYGDVVEYLYPGYVGREGPVDRDDEDDEGTDGE